MMRLEVLKAQSRFPITLVILSITALIIVRAGGAERRDKETRRAWRGGNRPSVRDKDNDRERREEGVI